MGWKGLFLILAIATGVIVSGPVMAESAGSDEIAITEQKDIVTLADDKLVDTYIDVLAELEATKTFHATSGFSLKEYQRYKDLLKYRLRLIVEIHRRKLELPSEMI
ncbi:MAG: hypothetical protein HQK55_17430 [Deltaproteobacteria bacterium]|nr:hypothetical protein [Deltaproteobacteria bacterium]